MPVSSSQTSTKRFSTDREQAVVRLINCVIVVVYAAFCYLNEVLPKTVLLIYLYAIPFSLVILFWCIRYPGANRSRRIIGMLADLGTTTAAMSISGEASSPLFLIYLWTTVGNGFRYGEKYLYLSMCLSIIGFCIVLFLSPYWSQHLYFAGGLLMSLSVLPIYIAALLRRLQAATDEARKASLAKSQFLATMSHELRTPLNGVVGMSDLLNATEMTDEQRGFVNTIQSSSKTLLALIENILDFSKIEAGKTELEDVEFDLHELIHSITSMVYPQATVKGVSCSVHISADVPYSLRGDSIHLRQVLLNLLGNAVKFTDKGSIELNLFSLDSEDERVRLRFEVIDTGIGMTKKEQQSIFDNFTQADQSISRKFGGTGLGTTISKKLVKLMDGEIGVVSAPGRGSKFWFELEYQFKVSEPRPVEEEPLISSTSSILIIGVSGKRRKSLTQHLQEWGFDWEYADTMEEAYSKMQTALDSASGHDVVLIDHLSLGEENEIDKLALKIANDPRTKQTNLILISSESLAQSRRAALLASGYFCILNSPVEKRFLFNALHATSNAQTKEAKETNVTRLWNFKSNKGNKAKLKILVGEDNATNQKVIRTILEYAGYAVDIYKNGNDILNAIEEKPYDLIILDMHMPEIDGIEAAKALRFLQVSKKRIPIIMLTADATVDAMDASKQADIDFFMTKPLESEKLLQAIEKLTLPNEESLQTELFESSEQVLDHKTLDKLSKINTNPDFIRELISGFISDTKKLITKIKLSIEEENFEAVQEHAHAIKGSAHNIGALAIAESAKNIVEESKKRDYVNMPELYLNLVQISGTTFSALNAYLDEHESASL